MIAAVMAIPSAASAYCRTASCDGFTGARCSPAAATDCGTPLFWGSPCISFDLQQDASARVSLSAATAVFQQAFATWTTAACPAGATARIELIDMGPVACNRHEYNQQQGNANIIMFRDESWPHAGQSSILALTTVTFNLDTGEIYDADMELNSSQNAFTTGYAGVAVDLLSVATHEAGHFLGLAHSPLPDATMFADYKQQSISLRTLETDDREALCAVYPPGDAIPATCDPTPRHGFSGTCASETPPSSSGNSCQMTAAASTSAPRDVALLALVAAAALGARRRRAARVSPRST